MENVGEKVRDELSWVTLDLNENGEQRILEGTLEQDLRRDLGVGPEHPIFIPVYLYHRDGRTVPIHLMEGYAFVGCGLAEVEYYKLEKTRYVNKVLTTRQGRHRMRCLSVVPNRKIEELRQKLREITSVEIPTKTGVRVVEGLYAGLEGSVLAFSGDDAYVRIVLRSLDMVVTVPRVFLETNEE